MNEPRPGKRDAVAVRVEEIIGAPAGSFRWTGRSGHQGIGGLNFNCPCGCGEIYGCTFGDGRWTWNGDVEKPTVTPSLGCHAGEGQAKGADGYHWHGFLTAGIFLEC